MNNIDKSYQDLLHKIINKGKIRGDRTGTGTVSIFSHTLEMDMGEGFPLLTTKKMFVKAIIHELLWFLKGDTNIKYLVDNDVNIWTSDAYKNYVNEMAKDEHSSWFSIEEFIDEIKTNDEFANRWGELGPIYGKQWLNWGGFFSSGHWNSEINDTGKHFNGINQIQEAIDTLKDNPESRRILVSAWNVDEIKNMVLPPCHWAFELYTEELTHNERMRQLIVIFPDVVTSSENVFNLFKKHNIPKYKLSLKWHQRSVDTFLGLPFNITSYGFLLEMLAQQTNMVAGTLIGDLTNVHIYKNHLDQCSEQLSRVPMELPKLKLNKAKDIFSYQYDDFNIVDYKSHPQIKGKISV